MSRYCGQALGYCTIESCNFRDIGPIRWPNWWPTLFCIMVYSPLICTSYTILDPTTPPSCWVLFLMKMRTLMKNGPKTQRTGDSDSSINKTYVNLIEEDLEGSQRCKEPDKMSLQSPSPPSHSSTATTPTQHITSQMFRPDINGTLLTSPHCSIDIIPINDNICQVWLFIFSNYFPNIQLKFCFSRWEFSLRSWHYKILERKDSAGNMLRKVFYLMIL